MAPIARVVIFVIAIACALDPPPRLLGTIRTYEVAEGETLSSIGSRAGIEPRVLARDNNLAADVRLRPGARLIVDNRHIAPDGYTDGLVLNVPQRMLFVFANGQAIQAFPIAVGRATWRTPLGAFAINAKEVDPAWDVPQSIQREMAAAGRPVITRVGPGPENPLGRHWLGLTLPGVGIHGTNQPGSIFRFTTHGCVRMHPDDIATVFGMVEIGTPVQLIYEPVLVATDAGAVFVEVHPDVYGRTGSLAVRTTELLRRYRVDHLVTDAARARLVADRVGRAVEIYSPPAAGRLLPNNAGPTEPGSPSANSRTLPGRHGHEEKFAQVGIGR